jgi:hypothetical protein
MRLKTEHLPNSVGREISVSEQIEEDGPLQTSETLEPEIVQSTEPESSEDEPVERSFYRTTGKRKKEGVRLRAKRLREEAKLKGKKWYFTGEPCIYGHVKDRLVSNGKCRECNRLDSERSNRFGFYR